MAAPPRKTGTTDDASVPRWVKVSGLIATLLIALFVAIHLAGGGFRHHHAATGGASPAPPPSVATERGTQRP